MDDVVSNEKKQASKRAWTKYNSSPKGKAYKKAWREKNHDYMLKKNREYYARNKDMMRKRGRDYYNENKQGELDRMRLKNHGISGEIFREMFKKQHGKCSICKISLVGNPSVDHNHITNKIRGLICNHCNLAIGNAMDSPKILRAMARYLERTDYD